MSPPEYTLSPTDLQAIPQGQKDLYAEYNRTRKSHEQIFANYRKAIKKEETLLDRLITTQDRIKNLNLAITTHQTTIIGPISQNLLALRAQISSSAHTGAYMVAHVEYYRFQQEITHLLHIKTLKARVLAKQERLVSKLGEARAQAKRSLGELGVSLEALLGLVRRAEALRGGSVGEGRGVGGGDGDGDAGFVETLDAPGCTAVVEERDVGF